MQLGPRSAAWRAMGAALLAQTTISIVDQGFPTLTPFIRDQLGLSTGVAALVVASVALGRVAGSYQAGRAVDAIGERVVLVGGCVGIGALVLVASAPVPLAAAIPCFVGAGVCAATATPAGGKIVLVAFRRRRRGLAMGIRQMGIPVGGLVAALLLPPLAATWGWRTGLAVAGAVALAGSAGTIALLGRHTRSGETLPGSARPRPTWRTIAQDRDVLLLTVWGCLLVSGQFATIAFLALYCNELDGTSVANASGLVVIAQVGGVLGRVLWGGVSDSLARGRRKPLLVAITCAGATTALSLALLPRNAPYLAIGGCALAAGLSLIGWQGLWMTAISELAGPVRVGAISGFGLTFVAAATAVAAPFYGSIADVSGTLRATWLVLAIVILAALVPLAMLDERRVGEADPVPTPSEVSA